MAHRIVADRGGLRHIELQIGGGIDKGMGITFHGLPVAVKNYCRLALYILHGDALILQRCQTGEAEGVIRGGAAVVGEQGVYVLDGAGGQ